MLEWANHMAHDRDDSDRGSHYRQMGRFPSALPEKRQALLEHRRGLPRCVPGSQVRDSEIAKLPAEAGSGGNATELKDLGKHRTYMGSFLPSFS